MMEGILIVDAFPSINYTFVFSPLSNEERQ